MMDGIKEIIKKIRRKRRLRKMDDLWYQTGGPSWQLFPPSFYCTHSEEEIRKVEEEELQKLEDMIREAKSRIRRQG